MRDTTYYPFFTFSLDNIYTYIWMIYRVMNTAALDTDTEVLINFFVLSSG